MSLIDPATHHTRSILGASRRQSAPRTLIYHITGDGQPLPVIF